MVQIGIPDEILEEKLMAYLKEDVGFGDVSTALIPQDAQGSAHIFAKSSGIVAGLKEASILFTKLGIHCEQKSEDGAPIEKGEDILILKGKLRDILMAERMALNILMKLSSIATSTYDLSEKIKKKNPSVRIAATRKTTPGFGWFEKKAVYLGGGDTHRWNLSDMVLLKDTHRTFYNDNITELLNKAKEQTSFSKKIEIEIENPNDVQLAIDAGADIIMLDNMSPSEVKSCLSNLKNKSKNVLIEISGNITHDNIEEYASAGVNIISTSQIIFHPHLSVDYSLRLL